MEQRQVGVDEILKMESSTGPLEIFGLPAKTENTPCQVAQGQSVVQQNLELLASNNCRIRFDVGCFVRANNRLTFDC